MSVEALISLAFCTFHWKEDITNTRKVISSKKIVPLILYSGAIARLVIILMWMAYRLQTRERNEIVVQNKES